MDHLILAVDCTGYPSHWLTWQDAVTHDVLGKIAYGFGEHEFTCRGGHSRVTGRDSLITLKSILVLRGRSPAFWGRHSIPLTNSALFRRDQYMCAYCGKVTPRGLTRDHIIPLSRGGSDHWLNVCACCRICNLAKGSQTLEELGWELLYLPYAPNHQEGLILENRRTLSDQMELLQTLLPKHSRILQAA